MQFIGAHFVEKPVAFDQNGCGLAKTLAAREINGWAQYPTCNMSPDSVT